jgi:hypothetical protein
MTLQTAAFILLAALSFSIVVATAPAHRPARGRRAHPYTRVSTLAKALDDLSNLMTWKQRKTAEGLVRRPDLLTRLAGASPTATPTPTGPPSAS